jgi:hypothetical protein
MASMANPDQIIRDALRRAQALLAEYLAPGGPNDHQTVKQLFGILNDPAVIQALQRAEYRDEAGRTRHGQIHLGPHSSAHDRPRGDEDPSKQFHPPVAIHRLLLEHPTAALTATSIRRPRKKPEFRRNRLISL